MLSPSPFNVLYFASLVSSSFSINVQRNIVNSASPNPLPPPPAPPPLGPDNYPIGYGLSLRVQRPYGDVLPHGPTILCLASAQADLDQQAVSKGDVIIDYGYVMIENGIDIDIQSLNRREMVLSKASEALRGIATLMNAYPQLGTRAVSVLLKDEFNYLARIQISRARANVNATPNVNGTTQNTSPWNLTTHIDPKNYNVPHTTLNVSIEGEPPYGDPLPKDNLILALASAQTAANDEILRHGDEPLPGLWRFEEYDIGIDVYTQLSVDCMLSTLETGLLGLVDLVNLPGGIGAVAADFVFLETGYGEVASGRLKLLGPYGSASAAVKLAANATLIEQGMSASLTLVGGAVETGSVDTA